MKLLRFLTAIPLALLPALGMAQAYPSKPVRIIAPFPAGTGPDANARELAAELTKHLGVSVFVDNKPGASGIIGTDAAARSAPDGYTLVIGTTTSLSTVPHLYSKLPFNPEKDLIPVSLLGLLNTGLIANPQVPARNAAEVVALLKKQPLTLNAGTAGLGGYSHLAGLWFSHATGGQLSFIPYASSSPYSDLMAGQIQFMFDGLPAAAGNIASGKLKLLGITGNQRHPAFPDTPTFAELGIKDFRPTAWQGLMAPAGTPKPIIDRLAAAMKKIPENAELAKKWTQYGGALVCNSPEEFEAFIKEDRAMWGRVVKQAGIKLD
jgi:tripartite-type tricarboxylate transporter receptor subunit TctC